MDICGEEEMRSRWGTGVSWDLYLVGVCVLGGSKDPLPGGGREKVVGTGIGRQWSQWPG